MSVSESVLRFPVGVRCQHEHRRPQDTTHNAQHVQCKQTKFHALNTQIPTCEPCAKRSRATNQAGRSVLRPACHSFSTCLCCRELARARTCTIDLPVCARLSPLPPSDNIALGASFVCVFVCASPPPRLRARCAVSVCGVRVVSLLPLLLAKGGIFTKCAASSSLDVVGDSTLRPCRAARSADSNNTRLSDNHACGSQFPV